MNHTEIVADYLKAIGLEKRDLDFSFLQDLVAKHLATFAFSSVGCRLQNELPLDFESLYQRIVVQRRGGYCFEHNGLVYQVLEELGFEPKLYLARVIYNQDNHPGLTHRLTIIKHQDQSYVIDVGFGALGPRILVPLSGEEKQDRDKIFRIHEASPGEYHMQVFKDDDFFSLYRFELARYGQADCEVGHFYSHRHPQAPFVNNLVASIILENETRSLRNLEYWLFKKSTHTIQQITSADILHTILVNELGIHLNEQESHQLYRDLSS